MMSALVRQRRGAIRAAQSVGTTRSRRIPAPIGGWNERDGEDLMPPTDAVLLDNWFPGLGKVSIRGGYQEHQVSGMGSGNVDTIAEFFGPSSRKMIVGTNGNLYDATSTPSSLASGFSENRWQHVMFDDKLGLVNGTDAPQIYDGSTMSAMTVSGTGLTVANLIGVTAFKERTYFWEDGSADFWYSALNTLGGSLTKFPLSRVTTLGGAISSIGAWSRDGGDGADDLLVIYMTTGEVIVYQGTSPTSASTFALVGRYRTAEPLDVRGTVSIGADYILLTKAGYRSVASLLARGSSNSADPAGSISSKIDDAAIAAAGDFASNTGWQAVICPEACKLVVNVPTSTTTFDQHVMNTVTGAWCRFKSIPARCWGIYNGNLYFGDTAGGVYEFDSGNSDNGANIQADAQQAFWDMGVDATKIISASEPSLRSSGDISLRVGVDMDFRSQASVTEATSFQVGGANWEDLGTKFWEDWDDNWEAGQNGILTPLQTVVGEGVRCAPRMIADTSSGLDWLSTRILYKTGGIR